MNFLLNFLHYCRKLSIFALEHRRITSVMTEKEIKQMQAEIERLRADFDTKQLAELLGVSQERLIKLFRNKSIYRTPEAYIDNLRTINAMRMLRTQHNYSIAAIAEASGFNHVRTLQRRLMDVTGMTPADYKALFTRDM